jgi:hypothetical protein
MIAVDGFDELGVLVDGFSVWQSPISGLLSSVEFVRCGFLSLGSVDCAVCGVSCRLGTYSLRWRSVVSMTLNVNEEVISTRKVWTTG